MAYRSDFYTMRNIIGYTGNINLFPTVYFQRGREYGHITQTHTNPTNVGRERVENDPTYRFDNYYIDQKLHLVEWEGGSPMHISRNAMVRREFFRGNDLLSCGAAIYRCQNIKKTYDEVADGQQEKHQSVMQQMMHKFEVLQSPRTARDYRQNSPDRVIDSVLYG